MPEYLTKRFVMAVHRDLIETFGGSPGVRDEGRLEAALATPRATFGGTELYPTVAEKAAAYLVGIAKGHPFVDGNKRTAFAAMEVFLRLNGWELTSSDEEAFELVIGVARCTLGVEEAARIIGAALPGGETP